MTGPEGFTIDLTKCPAGWTDTEGLTDTSIKIGQSTSPRRAPAADYGNLGRPSTCVFDYYSDKGAFKDSNGKTRKINYIVKDDGYDAGPDDPDRRRAARLREGVRRVDARHADHAEDLRQDQPALHPPARGDQRLIRRGVIR